MTKRSLENALFFEMEQSVSKNQKLCSDPNYELKEYEQELLKTLPKLKQSCSEHYSLQFPKWKIEWDLFTTITHSSNLPRDLLQNKVRQQIIKLVKKQRKWRTDSSAVYVQTFMELYEQEVMMNISRTFFANLFSISSSNIKIVAKNDANRCLGCKVYNI